MYKYEICNSWLIIMLMINQTKAKVNLSPQASWNQNGATIIGLPNGTAGSFLSQLSEPFGISITTNEVLYISDTNNNRIVVVDLDSTTSPVVIGSGPSSNLGQFHTPCDLFTTNTSLYVIDLNNHRVQRMSLNGSDPTVPPALTNLNQPYCLYVDNNDNIYLSDTYNNQVLLFVLNSTSGLVIAGTGSPGSNNDQLSLPYGVFVNHNGTIYIADSANHRIMKWLSGASFGIVAAGDGTAGNSSTQLNHPTQVIVDANEYMYISDFSNSRIIRWAPNSSYGVCIAACTGASGTASTQLNSPCSLAFDSNGSLYVSDSANNRIQKFQILQYQDPFYNQPKFSSCASWNPNAITFADQNTVGTDPYGLFIDTNNTIYLPERSFNRVQIWTEGNIYPTRNISDGLISLYAIFATMNGDIYIDNGNSNRRVDKWTLNANKSVPVMYVRSPCYSLFVDIYSNLYCSLGDLHQVIKISFNNNINSTVLIAGNGTAGSASDMLNGPRGIFVNSNLTLYVADCNNNRIQHFETGEKNGTTIVDNWVNNQIALNCPVGIIFDADGYLFIADSQNNRIIGSGPNGYRCIVGCFGSGSSANQLSHPRMISFDSYGNLFVVDAYNNRTQKFLLATNSCVQQPSSFVPFTCSNGASTGLNCNISGTACDMLQPCQNDGTCTSINNTQYSFICLCLSGFNGTQCELDYRPCKQDTCWNNGICNETSNTTFICLCESGWDGIHCELKINYCQNVTCQNRGVCQPLLLNFTCECLGESYSGRYCEVTSNKLIARQAVSRSFAYIAILAMTGAAMFIIIMDLLKYYFGIDPVAKELEGKKRKKHKRKPVIQRFVYVNAPAVAPSISQSISIIL